MVVARPAVFESGSFADVTESVIDATTTRVEDALTMREFQEVVLRTLASSDEPLSTAAIQSQLPHPYRGTPERLTEVLESGVDQGRVHRFTPYRVKADRFWDRSPIQYAERLLTTQTHGRFATKNELITQFKARCRDVSIKKFDLLIKELARGGQLHSGKFLGSRAFRYSADPIDAVVVAKNAIEQIAKRSSQTVDELFQQLIAERADQDLSPPPLKIQGDVAAMNDGPASAHSVAQATELIWDAIREICPDVGGGGGIVPITQVRRILAFKVDRETLDSAFWSLERGGQIDFTVHPDPGGLTSEQRSELLDGRAGKLFDMLIVRR